MEKRLFEGKTMLDYARMACDTMLKKFDAPDLPPVHRFHYHQGVFLSGVYKTYELSRDERYFEYVKAWVDSLIDPYGDIESFNPGQLDDLQPGILLFPLYERTGDERYKIAMDTIAYYIETFPCNPDGGFWHKAWYRDQMWLDGLYMGGPFAALYGKAFDKPNFFDLDVFQAELMQKRLRDEKTGLWYHAWDYNCRQPWADAKTGLSPEFWGRAMGWVPVALLDDIDCFPDDHPGKAILGSIARDLLAALLPYQDAKTGLWYQVTDKGDQPDNWVESSCTCLYVAAICKAYRMGLVDESWLAAAAKGCEGIVRRLGFDEKGILIDNICIGTCVGDYAHYCARPTSTNDLHGVGAFLIMCSEVEQTL